MKMAAMVVALPNGGGIAISFGNHGLQMAAMVAALPNGRCRGLDLEVSMHPVMICSRIHGFADGYHGGGILL